MFYTEVFARLTIYNLLFYPQRKCVLILFVIYYFGSMKTKLLFIALLFTTVFVQAQSVGLFPVQIKNKWGYTNAQGKLAIAANYDYAEYFYEGRAVVAINNQPCVINANNQIVVDTGLYSQISRFSEGLAKATTYKGVQMFIDANGNKVFTLDASFYDARLFKNGLSSVAKKVDLHEMKFNNDIVNLGYKFGFINKQGIEVIPCTLDDADDFDNGLARYREGTKFGLMDTNGNVVVKPMYGVMGRFCEDVAIVSVDGKFGFIGKSGAELIKPTYQYAYDFSEGLAGVRTENKFGYINRTGQMIIAAQYEAIRPFSGGLAAVKLNGKWGFINEKGKLVLRHVFDDATLFVDGRCPVMVKRKWGFIDETGMLVIPAEFDAVGTFNDGVAEVMIGQVNVFVNKAGMVLPQLK